MEIRIEDLDTPAPVVHLTPSGDDSVDDVIDAFRLTAHAGDAQRVWVHGTTGDLDAAMERVGMRSNRTLLQLRAPLPVPGPVLTTRPFRTGDEAAFIEINNRAFAWHPEQSGMTTERLAALLAESWFDAEGFRLHEIDGRLAGFCWTKVHRSPEALGEIFVIAIDPDFAGQGLGAPMTAAGLAHLHGVGLETAMLYVESDNVAARRTYERLGFEVHRRDRLWTVA